MTKVAQIIPYFGKWPEWMPLYLYSCGRNPMIDFIFYTDCGTPEVTYPNTKFIHISFEDYCSLVSQRLGIEYKIKNSYKLTDLKPFLGAIHQQELSEYDFWSFGDIDLCYGDLSIVVNEDSLYRYDVITTHCYHIAGHLTIVRNNQYYRDLCYEISEWENKISSDQHYSLDEAEWSNLVFPELNFNRRLWKYIVSPFHLTDFFTFMDFMNRINGRNRLFKEFFTSPAPKSCEEWIYDQITHKIFDAKGRELPYLHFLFFKKTPWFKTNEYWRDGFYQLSKENLQSGENIVFSLKGIYPK